MNGQDDTPRFNRRRALQILGAGVGAATGVLVLSSKEVRAAPAALNCKNKVPVDPAAVQMRRNLQYTEKSVTPGKKCSNCAQFEAGKYKECGGCKLFAGAVNPEGNCLSWAAKLGAPPAK